jgi:ABC-2 type transport system ATP-binding protein
MTSHYMSDIEALCRRTVLINRGVIVYDGALARVNDLFNARKILRLELESPVGEDVLSRYGDVKSCEGLTATLEIDRDRVRQVSRSILDTLPVADFTMADIPIEDGIANLYLQGGPDA